MAAQQVTVEATVPLPPDRAWEIYTDPHEITRWNFASDDWHCPTASVDLRPGGVHKARMEAKDGSFGFDLEGTYAEIDAPRALTLVLGDGRRCRTTFEQAVEGTIVRTIFDAEEQNPPEMQRDGWQAILNNYRARARQVAAQQS